MRVGLHKAPRAVLLVRQVPLRRVCGGRGRAGDGARVHRPHAARTALRAGGRPEAAAAARGGGAGAPNARTRR
eukprot:3381598-Pleurochrysis_carterae.AAC.1